MNKKTEVLVRTAQANNAPKNHTLENSKVHQAAIHSAHRLTIFNASTVFTSLMHKNTIVELLQNKCNAMIV